MNDIEDLVRQELRARVAAAEAAAAGGQPTGQRTALLGELDRRIRRARLRRRWTAALLSATAFAAAIVLPLTLLTPGATTGSGPSMSTAPRAPVPLSDPSLTPSGWSPLTYRDAQVSVPSSWVVQEPLGSLCGVTTGGGVLLGRKFRPAELNGAGCRLPATSVSMSPIPWVPRPVMRQRINGIPVGRLPAASGSLSYAVPVLGVEVTATGPKASQVLATLTRSPASVVLAPGPAFAVPRGWRWHDFGGIRFATPGAWRLARSDRWGSCDSRPVEPGTLLLSTATTFGCRGGMEMIPPLARSWAPTSGVTVGAGRLATADATPGVYRRCIRLRGMRTCIPHEGMQVGEFLILVAYPRGRPGPTLVEIGLAGNGATARTIFDSIRPR